MIKLDAFEKRLNAEGINLVGTCLKVDSDIMHVHSHHDSGLRLWVSRSPRDDGTGQVRLTKARWEVVRVVRNGLVKKSDKLIISIRIAPPEPRRAINETAPVFN